MFLFQLISILLISITFYTDLTNIIFSCDLVFKAFWLLCGLACKLQYREV